MSTKKKDILNIIGWNVFIPIFVAIISMFIGVVMLGTDPIKTLASVAFLLVISNYLNTIYNTNKQKAEILETIQETSTQHKQELLNAIEQITLPIRYSQHDYVEFCSCP